MQHREPGILAEQRAEISRRRADKSEGLSTEDEDPLAEMAVAFGRRLCPDQAGALAASLLGQIALKQQPLKAAKEDADGGKPALDDIAADNGKPMPDWRLSLADSDVDTDPATKLSEHAVQQQAELNGTAKQADANAQLADKATLLQQTPLVADSDAAEIPLPQQALQSAKASGETGIGVKPDGQPLLADNGKPASTVAASLVAELSAENPQADTEQPQRPLSASAEASTDEGSKTPGKPPLTAANLAERPAAQDSKDSATATAIATAAEADSTKQTGADKVKVSDNMSAADIKLAARSLADKAENSSGDKSASQQPSSQQGQSQQNPSQHSAAQQNPSQSQQSVRQQLAEGQLSTSDSVLAQSNTRGTPDVATTTRSEAVFSHSLQAAEQRQQQANVQKATSKSPAEQLKQSLNLLQQDAATNLRERVTLMVRQNIQVAEIRLDPAGLGQMQIKIDMQQEQASVQFIVQQPQAKELLEQQLPRLREMLQQQGIQLTEGQVQQQSQQQERQMAQRNSGRGNGAGGNADGTEDPTAAAVQVNVSHSERLVDYYA